jgi:LacI family transcriptional regulator
LASTADPEDVPAEASGRGGVSDSSGRALRPDDVPAGRATVLDVARMAGVSGRTVSRVVLGGPNVSAETHERVMAAVHTLRFRPNRLARDLRTGGVSTTAGFVVGDLTNPFYMKVAAGIERVLGDVGLTMLLSATKDDAGLERRAVSAVLEHRVRALLLVPIGDDHAYLEHERALGTRIVAVDRPAANVDLDSVVFDNRGGAAEGVRTLVTAGHRRIAFVGSGGAAAYTHLERLAGYHDALREGGLAAQPSWVRSDAPDAAAAEQVTRGILGSVEAPTAVFAANNKTAIGVIRALRTQDLQIGLMTFDDFDFADALGVSVVAHDPDRMGTEAARLALSSHWEALEPTHQLVLPTRVIHRGSAESPPAVR